MCLKFYYNQDITNIIALLMVALSRIQASMKGGGGGG